MKFVLWLTFLILLATVLMLEGFRVAFGSSQRAIELTMWNPYGFSVRAEVKCDHDYRINAFRFHKWILVRAKQNTVLEVPSDVRRCEVWPKVVW